MGVVLGVALGVKAPPALWRTPGLILTLRRLWKRRYALFYSSSHIHMRLENSIWLEAIIGP